MIGKRMGEKTSGSYSFFHASIDSNHRSLFALKYKNYYAMYLGTIALWLGIMVTIAVKKGLFVVLEEFCSKLNKSNLQVKKLTHLNKDKCYIEISNSWKKEMRGLKYIYVSNRNFFISNILKGDFNQEDKMRLLVKL